MSIVRTTWWKPQCVEQPWSEIEIESADSVESNKMTKELPYTSDSSSFASEKQSFFWTDHVSCGRHLGVS